MTKEIIRKIASRFLKISCYHGEGIIDEDIIGDAANCLLLDEVFINFQQCKNTTNFLKKEI